MQGNINDLTNAVQNFFTRQTDQPGAVQNNKREVTSAELKAALETVAKNPELRKAIWEKAQAAVRDNQPLSKAIVKK